MMRRLMKVLTNESEPILGRWKVKSCEEISSIYNSIYQNRDHCGDIICKTPKKAEEYVEVNASNKKKKHLKKGETK